MRHQIIIRHRASIIVVSGFTQYIRTRDETGRNSDIMTTNPTVSELRHEIISRLREIAACVGIADNSDLLEELEEVQKHIITLDSLKRIPEELLNLVSSARSALHEKQGRVSVVCSGTPGRPAFHISKEQLEMLLKARFSVPCIAELLCASSRTIERRMQEYGLSVRAFYTEIQDCQLDYIVRDTKRGNPGCGSKMLIGYLSARGIFLPRRRVRESLSRVDPLAVAAQRCKAIRRRVYNVKRPLGLWHFDGNHKLVKWRFVVNGCVDGFTRLPVFLSCSTNNTAATVYSLFIKAVQEWGLPSRVRCDQGSENVDVVKYTLSTRGTGRGSALVGKSVHNQRIERLWRDVFKDDLANFYEVFSLMEELGILDPLSEIDLWCLHFAFLPHINYCLHEWSAAWSRHPLSTAHNNTPLQLWIKGSLNSAEDGTDPIDVSGVYGIDWDGPVPLEEDTIEVPPTSSPLTDEQLADVDTRTASLQESSITDDKQTLQTC